MSDQQMKLPGDSGLLITNDYDWYFWVDDQLITLGDDDFQVGILSDFLPELASVDVTGYTFVGPSAKRFRAALKGLMKTQKLSPTSLSIVGRLDDEIVKLAGKTKNHIKTGKLLDLLEKSVDSTPNAKFSYLRSLGLLHREGHVSVGGHQLVHKSSSEVSDSPEIPKRGKFEFMVPVLCKKKGISTIRLSTIKEMRSLLPTDKIEFMKSHQIKSTPDLKTYVQFLQSRTDDGKQETPQDPDAKPMTIPLSFEVPPNYFPSVTGWPDTWPTFPGGGGLPQPGQNGWTELLVQLLYESILATWGLNTYDGACWELGLFLTGNKSDNMENLRQTDRTTQFGSIDCRAESDDTSNLFHLVSRDENGFSVVIAKDLNKTLQAPTFRMISNYFSFKQRNNGNMAPQFQPTIFNDMVLQWMDWRPITGELVWTWLIGPGHTGGDVTKIIPTLPYLEDKIDGGFYYSPINKDLNALQISSENNASAYGGLSVALPKLSGDDATQVKAQMNRIINYFTKVLNKTGHFFYQGRTWQPQPEASDDFVVKPGKYIPNGILDDSSKQNLRLPTEVDEAVVIPVDCQTWTIASLQPDIIDGQIFNEEGASLKMWDTLRETCGQFTSDGKTLNGYGYNNMKVLMDTNGNLIDINGEKTNTPVTNDTISAEWTLGAILAGEVLSKYYSQDKFNGKYVDKLNAIDRDIDSMRRYVDSSVLTDNGKVLYATKRAPTGFGWFANPIPSTTSTSWVIFDRLQFNPFVPIPSNWNGGVVGNYLRETTKKLQCTKVTQN